LFAGQSPGSFPLYYNQENVNQILKDISNDRNLENSPDRQKSTLEDSFHENNLQSTLTGIKSRAYDFSSLGSGLGINLVGTSTFAQ
jgi:hypothetical protein